MIVYKCLLILFFGSYGIVGVLACTLYIAGLIKMLPKSGIDGRWAFVPCARDYMLARCANREVDGRVYSFLRFLSILDGILSLLAGGTIPFFSLFSIIVFVMELIYMVRIANGLCEIYNLRRWCIPLWVLFEGIMAMVLGFSSKYQPILPASVLHDESLSVISGTKVTGMGQGLTVNLEERSVPEFFHKKYLLQDIHMYVKPGHMVLLLGGSGAGKTTLLNAINGYEKADAKISLNGSDVYGQYRKMLFEIGFVPQQDLMRGKDTVYHTLMDTALLRLPAEFTREERRNRVDEVLEMFGMTPRKNHLVEKLSGGQRKRVSIAMELLSNPSLFILDEPDSGLDGVMARELMQQLRQIADQGKIVIVITHTPDRVVDLFDDVIVLAKDANRTGRLAFYGSIDEARTFFGKEKMEEIVRSINGTAEGGEGKADFFIEKFVEVQNA